MSLRSTRLNKLFENVSSVGQLFRTTYEKPSAITDSFHRSWESSPFHEEMQISFFSTSIISYSFCEKRRGRDKFRFRKWKLIEFRFGINLNNSVIEQHLCVKFISKKRLISSINLRARENEQKLSRGKKGDRSTSIFRFNCEGKKHRLLPLSFI